MGKFCSKCGNALNESDKACPKCGTPVVNRLTHPTAEKVKPSSHKRDVLPKNKVHFGKLMKGVGAIFLTIVIIILLSRHLLLNSGYKATLNTMVTALEKYDMETLKTLASTENDQACQYWNHDERLSDVYDGIVSDALDEIEDQVGIIKSITYEIKSKNEYSKEAIEDFQETLRSRYDIESSDIQKIVKLNLVLTVKGTTITDDFDLSNLYMIKEKGRWKIYLDDFYY